VARFGRRAFPIAAISTYDAAKKPYTENLVAAILVDACFREGISHVKTWP
jgi:hypothetical protein